MTHSILERNRGFDGINEPDKPPERSLIMVQPHSESEVVTQAIRRTSFLEARLGATRTADGQCEFLVWAPNVARIEVRLVGAPERVLKLTSETHGYHFGTAEDVRSDARYWYRLD